MFIEHVTAAASVGSSESGGARVDSQNFLNRRSVLRPAPVMLIVVFLRREE